VYTGKSGHRILLDPTAEEKRAAEGGGGEDGGRVAKSSSGRDKRPRGRGRRGVGLLHLALMTASGEVTQVRARRSGMNDAAGDICV
jgi:hypothetical protein